MARTSLRLALSLTVLLGCQSGSVPVGHEDHRFEDGANVDLGTAPWRARRRMDIDQLDTSIRAVTGGIGWEAWSTPTDGAPFVRERYFDTYRDTLGVPDYINSSTEDLSVSLLFEKFLDDAARDVCARLAAREAGSGRVYDGDAQGVFAPAIVESPDNTPAEVSEALANLLLRFHGRSLEPTDPQLAPWIDLHGRLVAATADADPPAPQRVWGGVCVALITHPDFYTY
ncbi:MAG: hypothetical protein H6719_21685 [Sandaracinaceae bacterium]|nr:hypothetical protein [Sandaracinaceae bacterium]